MEVETETEVEVEIDTEEIQVQLNRGKKRVRHEHMWKKNIRKKKRARGEEYVSTTGDIMHAKKFQPVECSCPLKCSSKIDCERQAVLNQKFYALGDWSLQNAFLYGQVKVSSIRHRYTKSAQSRRQQSKFYYLGNSNGEDVRVCKEFF